MKKNHHVCGRELADIDPSDLSEAGQRARNAARWALRDLPRARARSLAKHIADLCRAVAARVLRVRMRANLTERDDAALGRAGLGRDDLAEQMDRRVSPDPDGRRAGAG